MTLQAHRIRQAIRIAILLGTASAAALANQSPTWVSAPKTPICYCHCDHGAGAKQCTKIGDLPQYEKRWGPTPCHKKSTVAKQAAAPDSNSHSRKTNDTEEARR